MIHLLCCIDIIGFFEKVKKSINPLKRKNCLITIIQNNKTIKWIIFFQNNLFHLIYEVIFKIKVKSKSYSSIPFPGKIYISKKQLKKKGKNSK